MALATLVAILVLSAAATARACPRQVPHDASSAQASRSTAPSQGSDCMQAAAGQIVQDAAVPQPPRPSAITLLTADSTPPHRPALPDISRAIHAPEAARPQDKSVLRI